MSWIKSKFRIAEMAEPDDMKLTRDELRKYVKVGNTYMKAIYYSPVCGPTDGNIYIKNNKT